MRPVHRSQRHEEEEESAFISMTDMTVSFLFIILILLAFFATQIAPKNTVPQDLYDKVQKDLQDRDRQVQSLLRQLEVFRMGGDKLVPWLQAERERLLARVAELEGQSSAIRAAMRVKADADLTREARLLREENDRLHRLLDERANPIERYNTRIAEFRGQVLDRIQKRINTADKTIDVAVSRDRDALEFQGKGLFGSDQNEPTADGRKRMQVIAGILREELRCIAFGDKSAPTPDCNPALAVLEALQIEGHTDSRGTDTHNMDLSSGRGSSVYAIMVTIAPDLLGFRNLKGQPVLSVAGYGKGRPIRDNDTETGRDANRRIDLRFIMFAPTEERFVPRQIDDLQGLRERLTASVRP